MTRSDTIERVYVRRISPTLGMADVRLPAVNLCGLRIEELDSGELRITPPSITGRNGREYPCFALQPGAREEIESAIAALWRRQ